jgi:hypothetical protein
MSEISERDLRRRLARQNDSAFAARVSFAELTAGAVQPSRRPVRRVVFAVLALVAILGAGVAIVAVRRPVAPTTPAVSVPPPLPATTAARDDAAELAQRVLAAEDVPPRPTAAACHAMSAREREAATVNFGPTSLPLYTCTLTFAGVAVPYAVQLLPNGCFVSHPVERKAKPSVIYGCGVTPALPVTGMALLRQGLGGSLTVGSDPVVRSRLSLGLGGPQVGLATYTGERGLTCFAAVADPDNDPHGGDEPVCPGRPDLPADLRVVKFRDGQKHLVLAGLVDRDVTAIRIGAETVGISSTPVPGTTLRPVLLDLDRITAGSRVEVLVGSKVVEEFDPARGTPHPPIDAAQMLPGHDAVAACQALGERDCEIDYEIFNPNGRDTAAPVAADAPVVLVDWAHCCEQTIRGSVAELATALKAQPDDPIRDKYRLGKPFWVTVENGVVTRIEDQYLP